jgi:hypothetical protein
VILPPFSTTRSRVSSRRGVEDDDQGAARGLRRALVGAGEAAGDPAVGEGGVVGAVVRERPAEHLLEEGLCFLQVGGVELDVDILLVWSMGVEIDRPRHGDVQSNGVQLNGASMASVQMHWIRFYLPWNDIV